MKRRIISIIMVLLLCLQMGVSAEAAGGPQKGTESGSVVILSSQNADGTYSVTLDETKWSYDASGDVWYQIGLVYCADPDTTDYETLGIYVPGAYMTGTQNSSGLYTCTISAGTRVGNYTAETAPFIMPVNTAGLFGHVRAHIL